MRVIIVDRNTENLNLAKETLAKVGEGGGGDGAVEAHDVDVSNREHWERLRGAVGNVDFLMLNAGVGYKGDWGDADYFDKVRTQAQESSFCIPSARYVGKLRKPISKALTA